MRLHILYHADKEPICGVEFMEELQRHGYEVSAGTLYPILHGMEKAGYLKSHSAVVAGKRRKNYTITPAGRRVLVEAQKKVRELVSEVVDDIDKMNPKNR